MTKSQIFFSFCVSFVFGIFLNSIISLSQIFLLGLLILGIFPLAVFWNRQKAVVAGFCLIFLAVGAWRYGAILEDIPQVKEENINFTAVVVEEPDIRDKTIKLTVQRENAVGKILVTTDRYPEYRYGDKLKITGKLEAPPVFEGFNYRDYLKKDGIFAVMSLPKIELLNSNLGNPVLTTLFSFKNKFKEAVRRFMPSPQEGFLEALIFGDENNISDAWKQKLNLTGTRHIVAVSGMNITIIASLILNFLLALGFWKKRAFYFSLFLITLYVLMIGAPTSAVRAGLMGGILLVSQYLGRLSSATRSVVFAAALMLCFNPLLLRLDIGFQLSFLAVLGMIYFQPRFLNWLKKIPDGKIFPVRTTLATTFSAQIFTFPILIYNFGYVPLVSPLTNVLIVPFLAPITILVFVFGLVSMIFWPLGYLLSWPAWLALTYITSVINVFSKIPKIW